MTDKRASGGDDPLARVRAIAAQLRELDERLHEIGNSDVALSLFERAAELADEAAALLERAGSGAA